MGNNGPANGNGNTVKDDLKNTTIDDLVTVSIVALFFVQKLGKASAQDVIENIKKIQGEVNEHILDQALEGLRGRGLLSYARGRSRDGDNVKMYKTTKVKWAAPPEIAHISDLLPVLVSTEEAKEVIDILNDSENEGDGESKSKRKLGYDDYWDIKVDFKTLNPMLGSTPPDSPFMAKLIKKSTYPYPEKADLRFLRDEETGCVVIPSDVITGWLRTGIRFGFSLSDAAIHYISADDALIHPTKLDQIALPVIDPQTKKGLGVNTYEVLPRGTEFSIIFRIPSRGVAEPEIFVAWLMAYAPKPLRGLSPARGKRFGKCEVVGYKVLGQSVNVEVALNTVADSLSDPRAKKLMGEMLAKAKQYSLSFKPKKGGAMPAEAAETPES